MTLNLPFFRQLAKALAKQFGDNCEVVLHDLTSTDIEHSVVLVENGHVTHRAVGDGPSHVVLEAMKADSGIDLAALKVDGGASANDFLMQTQSDIINAPVNRPQCVETTAMGAAYLAGLAVGYWTSKEDVIKNWAIDKTFEPLISDDDRAKQIKGWNKAVKYAYGWAKED